ncbi:MAG: hypothetical protein ACI4P5_03325 [Candidatus Fimadaptatus sp.]
MLATLPGIGSSMWLYTLSGLLLGLLPFVYQLGSGRPGAPQPVALICGAGLAVAAAVCAKALEFDAVFEGVWKLLAFSAACLLALSLFGMRRRAVAVTSLIVAAIASLGAWLLYRLLCILDTQIISHSLHARLTPYFMLGIAFVLGALLPLPRLARRPVVPLTVLALQLIVWITALLGYSGVVRSGFVSFCVRLTLGTFTANAMCLSVGLTGLMLRQTLLALRPGGQTPQSA